MNEVLKVIAQRRSVRQFKEEQIQDEALHAILEAGIQAPSGHNEQSWHFTVVQNKELINNINDGAKLGMRNCGIEWIVKIGHNENLNIFYKAPTIIIVSAKKNAVTPLADVSGAIENMMLAAESLGLGSCWIGFTKFHFTSPEKAKELAIPEGYEVQYAVSIGYKPDGYKMNPPQRKKETYFNIIK